MFSLRKITIASTLTFLFSPFTVIDAYPTDYDEERILDPKGQTVFLGHFYNNGPRQFSNDEKNIIKDGLT